MYQPTPSIAHKDLQISWIRPSETFKLTPDICWDPLLENDTVKSKCTERADKFELVITILTCFREVSLFESWLRQTKILICLHTCLKLGHERFLPYPFQLFTIIQTFAAI
jgi:hypothetical protein